jgi:AraC family transcriptional regulator
VSSPLSLQRTEVPPAPASQPQLSQRAVAPLTVHDGSGQPTEKSTVLPATMQRLIVARTRIYEAARAGLRIRTYEVALDLDMSEFHFARQFRLAFERSPHVYYDEVRAETARGMLEGGLAEGTVARRIGFRRPAELRALLGKRPAGTLPPDLARV